METERHTSSDRKIRYAVVGLGRVAQSAVLPAFEHARENSALVALVSSDPEKRAALAKRYHVEHVAGYDELESVARSVDAVYVAVPNALHRDFAERAAAAGLHVLCEKPMATTVEDCEAMIAAARACGVRLMIGYRLHFEPAQLRAFERVWSGEIGAPVAFSSVFSHAVRQGDVRTRADLGGGALFDMGVDCIHAARRLFRDEPLTVQALQLEGAGGVDEVTVAVLGFAGGRVAQITCHQGAADVSELRIVGTRGDVRLEPAYDPARRVEAHVTVAGATDTRTSRRDPLAAQIVHFSDAILRGEDPEPAGEEGLCDVRVIQAIRVSARSARPVRLAPWEHAQRPARERAWA